MYAKILSKSCRTRRQIQLDRYLRSTSNRCKKALRSGTSRVTLICIVLWTSEGTKKWTFLNKFCPNDRIPTIQKPVKNMVLRAKLPFWWKGVPLPNIQLVYARILATFSSSSSKNPIPLSTSAVSIQFLVCTFLCHQFLFFLWSRLSHYFKFKLSWKGLFLNTRVLAYRHFQCHSLSA